MADPAQPSDRAVGAARYLRMVGATRRRRPRATEPEPPVIEIDPIDPIDVSEAEPFDIREARIVDGPDVTIDEPTDDSWSDALRDSYQLASEDAGRDRAVRIGAEIDPVDGAEHSGFVPIRDERDRQRLRMDAADTQSTIDSEIDQAEAEDARRHLMRQGMSFDDPRVAETFMNEAERERYRNPNHVHPSMFTSAVRGFAQGPAGGGMDEILGTIEGALTDEDAADARERWEQAYADAELENPVSYDLGQALSLIPALISRGGIQGRLARWSGDSPTAFGRIMRTGGVGSGLGAYSGIMSSRDPLFDGDTIERGVSGAMVGGGLGVGGAALGEGLDAAIRNAPRAAQALDDAAAPIRVRSAGGRTIGTLRELDEFPGGMEGIAQRLDETGIMPRGRMLDTPEDAGERAVQTMRRGGQRIGETFDAAANARAAETGLRGVSNAGTVDLEPIAMRLDDAAAHYSRIPGAQDQARIASDLAAEYRARGTVSLDEAQDIKRFLDTEINWRPTSGISSRLSPIQQSLRDVRGALVTQMDRSVERIGPEALANYQTGRGEYQLGHVFGDLARDNRLREAANRQFSPSDYAVGVTGAGVGAMSGGPAGLAAGASLGLLNRYVRQREASLMAGSMERIANGLRWVGQRDQRFAGMARALLEAASRSPESLDLALRVLQRNDPEQFQALDAAVQQAPAPESDDEYMELRQPSLGGAPASDEDDEYRDMRQP